MKNSKSEIRKQDRDLHSCFFRVWNLNDLVIGIGLGFSACDLVFICMH